MSKKDRNNDVNEVKEESALLKADSRQRIAIFTKNWMEATLLAHGLPNKCLKSWKSFQVVFNPEDIERLLSLNAPIRIFIEDVN
jgi:hypothetical protein